MNHSQPSVWLSAFAGTVLALLALATGCSSDANTAPASVAPGPQPVVSTTHALTVDGIGPVDVTVAEQGAGHPFLLLHGGAGPASFVGFSDLLSSSYKARVLLPTHPGFGGTPRPDALKNPAGLASVYVGLLEQLDLHDVTVVGNSIGGWIAAELALLHSDRVSSVVLVDAVGIVVDGHPVADPFAITLDDLINRSYYNPDAYRVDLSKLTDMQRAGAAANRAALAVYGGNPSLPDPTLRDRLKTVTVPTAVFWGEADRIADADYGRAFAAAIPDAQFQLLTKTGHLPQIETPNQLLPLLWNFAAAHAAE